jgi:hypothetical protein
MSSEARALNPAIFRWLSVILAVALIISGVGLANFINRIIDLQTIVNAQGLEIEGLQNENLRLEETLTVLNASLISSQKTQLVEVSLNEILTGKARINNTSPWMWILDSLEARSVDIPSSMLGTSIRLVSEDDVKTITMRANGTEMFSLDGVSLRDSTHGVVKFSQWDVFNVAGVPSVYANQIIIYYMERRAGNWDITGREGGLGDYFRLFPLFE